jgi:hypothetical protein
MEIPVVASAKYIKLDHELVPGRIKDIDIEKELPTGKDVKNKSDDFTEMTVKKYRIRKGKFARAYKSFNAERSSSERNCNNDSDFQAVAGTISEEDFYFDNDWGFFSAVLACYNNHWTLRTSPDDWWNVIVRNVAQAIDDNGKKDKVRNFFVDHQGQKEIRVLMPTSLDNINYSWLFDQFSSGIRKNIKTPRYVDTMIADFSTTTPDQLISSQIMLMSSLQKYFSYCCDTRCGIPGVEMKGTLQDWTQLFTKTKNLEKLLLPIMKEIGLNEWFSSTLDTLTKLKNTFEGNPDKEWWGHILSWNQRFGSGERKWWSGWIIDFLMAGDAQNPQNFQSGFVSVPLKIVDGGIHNEEVSDEAKLVAGTFGYTVEEGHRCPVVEAKQGWILLLPKKSPLIARFGRGLEVHEKYKPEKSNYYSESDHLTFPPGLFIK